MSHLSAFIFGYLLNNIWKPAEIEPVYTFHLNKHYFPLRLRELDQDTPSNLLKEAGRYYLGKLYKPGQICKLSKELITIIPQEKGVMLLLPKRRNTRIFSEIIETLKDKKKIILISKKSFWPKCQKYPRVFYGSH